MMNSNQDHTSSDSTMKWGTSKRGDSEKSEASSQHRATKRHSRRSLLIGGMAVGATLVTGNLFAGCSSITPSQQAGSSHLVLDTSWDGLDFAWLTDNTALAYTSDRGLFIVDRKSGKRTRSGNGPNYSEVVTWSADGTRIAYNANGTLLVQDVKSGQEIWSHQSQHMPHNVVLSPDGTRIAFSQDSFAASNAIPNVVVEVWDVHKGSQISQYPKQASKGEMVEISTLTWSPDGMHIASTNQEGSVQVWNTADGHLLWGYKVQAAAGPRGVISWSPDSSAIAFAAKKSQDQGLIGAWDAQTGKTLFEAETDVVYPIDQGSKNKRVAWSPDGTRLVLLREAQGKPVLEVWSVRNGQHLFTCQQVSGQLTSVTWSPDGKYIAAGNYIVRDTNELARGDNGDRSVIQFWNAQNGRMLFSYGAPKNPDSLAWSPDSQFLALLTPKDYGIVANRNCLSLCRYGYQNNALQVFQIEAP